MEGFEALECDPALTLQEVEEDGELELWLIKVPKSMGDETLDGLKVKLPARLQGGEVAESLGGGGDAENVVVQVAEDAEHEMLNVGKKVTATVDTGEEGVPYVKEPYQGWTRRQGMKVRFMPAGRLEAPTNAKAGSSSKKKRKREKEQDAESSPSTEKKKQKKKHKKQKKQK